MAGDVLSLAMFPARTGLNLSALVAIGLALHAALGILEREASQRRLRPGLIAALGLIAFAVLRLLMLNAELGDGTTWFDPGVFGLAWTALGPSTLALAGGAIILALGFLIPSRILQISGAVLAAAGFGLTGHTQGLTDPGPAPLAVAVHVLIAGFWIAAPLTLWPSARLTDDRLLARLERFSAIAVAAIPLLILLGVWLAWRLAGGFAPLLTSTYGRLLLLKLLAALLAMGMGALNKQVVTARIRHAPLAGRQWLRTTLTVEATLFLVAIVAISAATTIAGPGE